MRTKIVKFGRNLAILIPQAAAQAAGLREGDIVELTIHQEQADAPTLAELVARITPENRHDEISLGRSVGKEIAEW